VRRAGFSRTAAAAPDYAPAAEGVTPRRRGLTLSRPMLMEPHSNERDRTWIVLLVVSFLFGLAVSWQRWGNPLIDTGREMNVPLRLASGEMLYSDVRHVYGPLSPWVHAVLYRMFGPTLTVLYADGIACAAVAIALVYWLSRQIMTPAAAGAATMSLMWLCVFKPAGNYVLPYSFNALHGTVLGLATLAVLARAVHTAAAIDWGTDGSPGVNTSGSNTPAERIDVAMRPLSTHSVDSAVRVESRPSVTMDGSVMRGFLVAGVLAGLTLLAKTEMGMAAIAAGVVAAPLAGLGRRTRRFQLMLLFLTPAACLTVATYGVIAMHVGWSTLLNDSWLLAYNMAPELSAYNRRLAGLDRPLYSAWRVLLAGVKLGILASIVASVSTLAAGPALHTAGESLTSPRSRLATFVLEHPWPALAAAVGIAVLLSITTGLDWDKGPYLFMPVLLAALIVALVREMRHHGVGRAAVQSSLLLVYAVYALASIGRMVLHVRSGGAYGSYLLPMSIVIFTYLWVGPFAGALGNARTAGMARRIAISLILISAVVAAAMLGVRYRTRSTVAITSSRGTMIAGNEVGVAWNEALAFIETHTRQGDPVAVLPEGTSLAFLSGRRNPLREEIATPGFLDRSGEARAIRQLQDARAPLVLIANRPTAEFGPNAFGRDYCTELMRWVQAHYQLCAMFGVVKDPRLQVGDRPFFIRAYCRPDGT
jgi:hypothetical protein